MKENSILYEDLLLYKDILQLNDVKIVSMGGVDKKNDKIFKKILSDETEMAVFLCQFLKLKIKPNELEKYKNSFITQKYKSKESDIVYKHKNKNVYYLLEQQSKIDKNMPRRILRYCDELIEERKKNDMDEWIERIKRNDEKQRQKLIKGAVMKIVKNMLLNNEDDEKILKYADITQNELEKIKRKYK